MGIKIVHVSNGTIIRSKQICLENRHEEWEQFPICSWRSFLRFWKKEHRQLIICKSSEDICAICYKFELHDRYSKEDDDDDGDSDYEEEYEEDEEDEDDDDTDDEEDNVPGVEDSILMFLIMARKTWKAKMALLMKNKYVQKKSQLSQHLRKGWRNQCQRRACAAS